jgi:hypothetical protein
VPAENRGAYLVTTHGAMQVYSWYIEPPDFPVDAPELGAGEVKSFTVVAKQFDPPDKYQLYNLTTGQPVSWIASSQQGMHLSLDAGSLPPGQYMWITPTDSMFGGQTWQYFKLR